MLRQVIAVCLTSASLAVSGLVALPMSAEAQVRKDVGEFAGQRCSVPRRGSGIIVDSPFITGGDGLVPIDRIRCFSSMSECKGWLYTMQSKYTNAGAATLVRCTKR